MGVSILILLLVLATAAVLGLAFFFVSRRTTKAVHGAASRVGRPAHHDVGR